MYIYSILHKINLPKKKNAQCAQCFCRKQLRTHNVHNDSARTVHCAGPLCNNTVPHNVHKGARTMCTMIPLERYIVHLFCAAQCAQKSPHNGRIVRTKVFISVRHCNNIP